jgi:hypothetical protein
VIPPFLWFRARPKPPRSGVPDQATLSLVPLNLDGYPTPQDPVQRLVSIDVKSGVEKQLATLDPPPDSILAGRISLHPDGNRLAVSLSASSGYVEPQKRSGRLRSGGLLPGCPSSAHHPFDRLLATRESSATNAQHGSSSAKILRRGLSSFAPDDSIFLPVLGVLLRSHELLCGRPNFFVPDGIVDTPEDHENVVANQSTILLSGTLPESDREAVQQSLALWFADYPNLPERLQAMPGSDEPLVFGYVQQGRKLAEHASFRVTLSQVREHLSSD